MLADPKSAALTNNFAGQWLFLRDLAHVQTSAPNFDDNLRQSFKTETEMLFGTVVREDESLLRLLDANFTFLDERLARHYGIPNVHGSYFRRVELPPDSPRRGLLGHGSILTVTSVATRTSPVTRGRWILENLLGTPAPIPPPGVDTNLEKNPEEVKNTSLRHRSDAFVTNAAEKLFTYALGRPVEYFDMPTVRGVVHRAAQNDYRFSSLVLGVVSSDAFQMKMKRSAVVAGD